MRTLGLLAVGAVIGAAGIAAGLVVAARGYGDTDHHG